jgi:hypothetical protein
MIHFPTNEDMKKYYANFPFSCFEIQYSDFAVKQLDDIEGLKQIAILRELSAWKIALKNKWNDVAKSFALMMFYYDKGIPDEPYYVSPGRKGQSIEYFPYFDAEHFAIKDGFDFYADIYYFKVFSAIDGIWQILNVYFNLGLMVDKVSFKNVCSKLEKIDAQTAASLKKIFKDERYQKGKDLRNNITHRLPVGSQGTGIRRKGNATIFYVFEYAGSKQTVETAKALLNFSVEAFKKIKNLCNKNNLP